MDLLNRALEQVIDQLVTQKISNLKLEIENQKQTILGMVLHVICYFNFLCFEFDYNNPSHSLYLRFCSIFDLVLN